MAARLFTAPMGNGAHLLPFLKSDELRAVSAVSKDANTSFNRHLGLLYTPVKGIYEKPYSNESFVVSNDTFGDSFYLVVQNLDPYVEKKDGITFLEMINLLDNEIIGQKWPVYGALPTRDPKMSEIIKHIIKAYDKNPIGVTIDLTSSDIKKRAKWLFRRVLKPSFISYRKSRKYLKRSSKSTTKRRVLKNKSRTTKRSRFRSPKSRRH